MDTIKTKKVKRVCNQITHILTVSSAKRFRSVIILLMYLLLDCVEVGSNLCFCNSIVIQTLIAGIFSYDFVIKLHPCLNS